MKETTLGIPRFRLSLIAFAASALALAISSSPLFAQAGAAEREDRSMRIGIIGSGTMGGSIGLLWAGAGHQILFASRTPDQLMALVRSAAPRARAGYPVAAASFGEVVLLAVPPVAIPQIGEDFGHPDAGQGRDRHQQPPPGP